jgi:hypothetical protein
MAEPHSVVAAFVHAIHTLRMIVMLISRLLCSGGQNERQRQC